MVRPLQKMSMRDPEGYREFESQLRQRLIDFYWVETPDNKNRIVGCLKNMIRCSNDLVSDLSNETYARNSFDKHTLQLYKEGYVEMEYWEYKDFHEYVDINWQAYE